MTKARRPSLPIAAALALAAVSGARPAHAEPAGPAWEDALASCVPGAAFDDCVAALTAQRVTLRKEDTTDHHDVSFELAPPFGGVTIRTYGKAGGKIVMVDVVLREDKGKGRKDLLAWLKKQIGTTAKEGRSSIAGGAAAGCGEAGWGVGFTAKASQPEVQLQLDSPESSSANDEPDRMKPEDALVKRAGNGLVDLCFLLPPKGASGYVDAPEISPTVMKAFLASPRFHGKAKLK